LKLFIQCSGKDQRFIDGITGLTNRSQSRKTEHADNLNVVENMFGYRNHMKKLLKPNSTLLALFIFLPITPSIAAITVFTHSFLNERGSEVTSISHHAQRVIEATKY
tara:strand:+ start:151 stop:471 length:321 start_codon:yes stop_codon:yes gene_type:complete